MNLKANPFCSSLRLAAQALTLDSSLRMVWKRLPPGMGAGYDRWSNEIIMPAINTMELSEDEARKLNAFSYHERLHHYLTQDELMFWALKYDNPNITKEIDKYLEALQKRRKSGGRGKMPESTKDMKRGMCCTLTNYIEDCRIELNKHCRFAGDLEDLIWWRTGEGANDFEKEFILGLMNNPWGVIMQTLQYNLCGYRQFVIDEKTFPEAAKMYQIGWDILNDGRFETSCAKEKAGSKTAFDLAVEIIEAWKAEANRNIEDEMSDQKQKGKGKGKGQGQGQGEESEEEQDAEASEVQDGKNDLFKNDKEEESDGSGSGSDSEESEDDKKDKGSKSDSQSDKDGEEGEDEGEGDQSGPIIEDGERDIEGEFERDQEKYDGRYNINPDVLNQKAADLAREEGGEGEGDKDGGAGDPPDEEVVPKNFGGNSTNPLMKKCMKTPYIPYDVLDRLCYPKLFPENYSQVKSTIEDKIKKTSRELARLLIAESQTHTDRYLKRGKIDRRRLHSVVYGDERIFKKTTQGKSLSTAVQLIIDLSGSMAGEKARLAVQVACLFAEVLNSLNMPFEVLGYNTSSMPYEMRKKGEENGFSRFDVINHWVFKEFNEGWSAVHSRLGACCNGMRTQFGFTAGWIDTDAIPLNQKVVRDIDGCVGGANCDHETVLLGASRLFAQPQERKIQVVIADGLPNGHYGDYGGQLQHMLVAVNNRIIAAGIEQVAFGIQCDGVKNFYSKCVTINNLDELGPAALKYLSSSLRNYAMTVPDRWST